MAAEGADSAGAAAVGGTDDAVPWIAEEVGYRDRFFFSKDFKRLTGMTPREFRRPAQFE